MKITSLRHFLTVSLKLSTCSLADILTFMLYLLKTTVQYLHRDLFTNYSKIFLILTNLYS